MKNIIITGGGGFLGSHLCRSLVWVGYKVFCIDNFLTGNEENIKDLLKSKNFELINKDVGGLKIRFGDKIDYIFHLASPASPKDYLEYPIETLRVSSMGTYNMLELAKEHNAKFLLASTSEIYGDPLEHPQKESYWGRVNPVGPRSCYDEAKRFAEALTMTYYRYFKVKTHIIRIFNTYGPNMKIDDGRAVPTFIDKALKNEPIPLFGTGEQTRSFCYVKDLIKGIHGVQFFTNYPYPINLGNPNEITIFELAKIIIKLTNSSSKFEFLELPEDDPVKRKPDIGLAKKEIDWEPAIGLETGLKTTINWFKEYYDK